MGVLGQNDIRMLVSWLGTNNTTMEKVMTYPQVQAMVNLVSSCLPQQNKSYIIIWDEDSPFVLTTIIYESATIR